MPWGLKRFHDSKQFHFITFSCYHRQQKLGTALHRSIFEQALEETRAHYDFVGGPLKMVLLEWVS